MYDPAAPVDYGLFLLLSWPVGAARKTHRSGERLPWDHIACPVSCSCLAATPATGYSRKVPYTFSRHPNCAAAIGNSGRVPTTFLLRFPETQAALTDFGG